jgi:hypothetical protein
MRNRSYYGLVVLWLSFFAVAGRGQTETQKITDQDLVRQTQINQLVSDLKGLDEEAKKLDDGVARAAAKAEIADALWGLDEKYAQGLLKEAYDLTLPSERERERLRNQTVGADPTEPNAIDINRNIVLRRIIEVASRDKKFAAQFARLSGQELGREEQQRSYARLARQAVNSGDLKAAGDYFIQSVNAEPTRLDAGFVIYEVAAKDREAADKLILQYIERLRAVPLTVSSTGRVIVGLDIAVFADPPFDPQHRQVRPASVTVIKAYLDFILDSLAVLEQHEGGSLKQLRGTLLAQWNRINIYAPELRGKFLALEGVSRIEGIDNSLPEPVTMETRREQYKDLLKKASENPNQVDLPRAINVALSFRDFEAARKLADMLSNESAKARYAEEINLLEALSLVEKGEIVEAESIAQRLTKPTSISNSYSAMIERARLVKDNALASNLAYEAVKRLKKTEDVSSLPQAYNRLIKATAPYDSTLAVEMLEEMVRAINLSNFDAADITLRFNPGVFAELAPANEVRARQAAENLTDRLRRISALVAVYRWKAKEVTRPEKR